MARIVRIFRNIMRNVIIHLTMVSAYFVKGWIDCDEDGETAVSIVWDVSLTEHIYWLQLTEAAVALDISRMLVLL